jgi:hypothetical protein
MVYIFLGTFFLTVIFPFSLQALEQGEVKGKIERVNDMFNRDYNALDYKGDKNWQSWGKDLKSLGWIVVQGDSGELKDYLLLVVDTRAKIKKADGSLGKFEDLKVGSRITSSYRMGYDALHAEVVNVQ